jgi:hypothetical protein
MNRDFVRILVVAFASALFFCLSPVLAQQAGYDLLQTGSGASINLSSVPGISPSIVPLEGVPICTCAGNTDTIMYRTQAVPKIVPPAGAKIHLVVFALFLRNGAPVMRNNQPVDVYITVNNSSGDLSQQDVPQPDGLPASTGSLTVHSNAAHTSGTFDSKIQVIPDVIIVPQGANVRTLPVAGYLYHAQGPTVNLQSSGSPWISTPPAGYPLPCFPANGFYPGGSVPEQDPTNANHKHPVGPGGPGSPWPRCVSFNPATTSEVLVGTQWKVVDGAIPLFDFGARKADAQRAVEIIKHYGMNQSCTVGDPLSPQGPPFSYMLVSGAPPAGAFAGEDCNGFNPATAIVSGLGLGPGFWRIIDNNNAMFYFGTNKPEADQSLGIIKLYGFDKQCFVGRPTQTAASPFVWVYMRK